MLGGGVETLFGRIPFEQHFSYKGSSLTGDGDGDDDGDGDGDGDGYGDGDGVRLC